MAFDREVRQALAKERKEIQRANLNLNRTITQVFAGVVQPPSDEVEF
jgi:hypothetical protein